MHRFSSIVVWIFFSFLLPGLAGAQAVPDNGAWVRHETGNQLISMAAPADWSISSAGADSVTLTSPDGVTALSFGGALVEGGATPEAFLAETCDPAAYEDEMTTVLEIGVTELPVGGSVCRALLAFALDDNAGVGLFYFILYGNGEVVLTISGSGEATEDAPAAALVDFIQHAAATFEVDPDLSESQWTTFAPGDAGYMITAPPGWEMLEATASGVLTLLGPDGDRIVTLSAIPLDAPLDITLAAPNVQASYENQGGETLDVQVVNRAFGNAIRLTGRMQSSAGQEAFNTQLQYVFVRGNTLYFLTASAPESQFGEAAGQFEQIAATFSLF